MDQHHYPATYDQLFERCALEFFGDIALDWRWCKAQAIAESNLDPVAMSPAGAMGIMQLMPNTFAEMTLKLGLPPVPRTAALVWEPETNIRCGVAYARWCWDIWQKETGRERLRFMFAAYNAGAGNIIAAQRLAIVPDSWLAVAMHLPRITGRRSRETIRYVLRIEKIYSSIVS